MGMDKVRAPPLMPPLSLSLSEYIYLRSTCDRRNEKKLADKIFLENDKLINREREREREEMRASLGELEFES